MTIRRRIRDAITGRFTTRDHATAHPDTTVEESVDERFTFDDAEGLEAAVFQALGAASVCWENPAGGGIFDSDRAKAVGEGLVAWIRKNYVRRDTTVEESIPDGWNFSDEFAQEIFDAIHDEVHLWVEDHHIESATREVIAVLVARGLYR